MVRAAVWNGNLDMVQLLVESGAHVTDPTVHPRGTRGCFDLLLVAVEHGNAHVVGVLLQAGTLSSKP